MERVRLGVIKEAEWSKGQERTEMAGRRKSRLREKGAVSRVGAKGAESFRVK